MITVDVPGKGTVEFPDDTTQDKIEASLKDWGPLLRLNPRLLEPPRASSGWGSLRALLLPPRSGRAWKAGRLLGPLQAR